MAAQQTSVIDTSSQKEPGFGTEPQNHGIGCTEYPEWERIMNSSSWPCPGHLNNLILCLGVLPKCSLSSSSLGAMSNSDNLKSGFSFELALNFLLNKVFSHSLCLHWLWNEKHGRFYSLMLTLASLRSFL